MALLAEEIVEEWLNRQGYFTIRGIRLGVNEIDLVAVKFRSDQAKVLSAVM
jgi:Holliday junction resolvase-like predicted endonuclease